MKCNEAQSGELVWSQSSAAQSSFIYESRKAAKPLVVTEFTCNTVVSHPPSSCSAHVGMAKVLIFWGRGG